MWKFQIFLFSGKSAAIRPPCTALSLPGLLHERFDVMGSIGTKRGFLQLLQFWLALEALLHWPQLAVGVRIQIAPVTSLLEDAGDQPSHEIKTVMTLQITAADSDGTPLQALNRSTTAGLWAAATSHVASMPLQGDRSSSILGDASLVYIGPARTGLTFSDQVGPVGEGQGLPTARSLVITPSSLHQVD